jgi:hypothetical protein
MPLCSVTTMRRDSQIMASQARRTTPLAFSITFFLLCTVAAQSQSNHAVDPVRNSIQYVSSEGNDSYDGHDWDSAKLTIMAAYRALPGKGGTIYISSESNGSGSAVSCVNATATGGQGIWIAGPTDPNYNSLPTGWYRAKRVNFYGIPTTNASSGENIAQACVIAGNSANDAVKLSGFNGGMSFYNLSFQLSRRGIVIGEDSNGGRTGTGIWSGLWVDNVGFSVSTSSTKNGPAIDCTGGSFQLYFKNFSASANSTAKVGSNQQAAFLIDGANGAGGCALVTINDAHFNGGGLKYTGSPSISTFSIDGVICEAQTSGDACIHLLTAQNVTAHIKNIDVADCSGSVNGVQVDEPRGTPLGLAPDNVVAEEVNSGCTKNNQGEMTSFGQFTQLLNSLPVSPLREGQVGIIKGHVLGQQDSSRTTFGSTAVRFTNIVNPISGYTVSSGGTLKSRITAPDGTTGAVQGAFSTAPGGVIFLNSNAVSISVGDFFIAGVWVRSETGNGYAGGVNNVLQVSISGSGDSAPLLIQHGAAWQGDGEWEWIWQIQQVTEARTSPALVQMNVQYDSTHTIQAYAPILLHIPAKTVSANEVFNIAYNLQSYSQSCAVGTICGLEGQTETPAHLGQIAASQFAGTVALSNGKATVIFPMRYRTAPVCLANDTSSVSSGVKPTPTATSVEFHGAGNDSIAYICVGNPN